MKKMFLIGVLFVILGLTSACSTAPTVVPTATATSALPTQVPSTVIAPPQEKTKASAPPRSSAPTDTGKATPIMWTMLKLPDTGQTQDYTKTFGEDADYTINPQAFTVNSDGTVLDQVTGLMWQQRDGGEMIWANAASYCTKLNLGGKTDWRVPTTYELYSIINHDRNPALDPAIFTLTDAEYWWTANEQVGDSTRAWVVNAGGGIGAHPKTETVSAGGSKRYHTRCVRNLPTNVPIKLTDNGNGTVTDQNTQLVWQQGEVTPAVTWEAALTYCENLTLANRSDWRLPNIKELQSISDDTRARPSIDTTYFPQVQSSRYWSSTTLFGRATSAWFLDFSSGLTSYNDKPGLLSVRCVASLTSASVQTKTTTTVPTVAASASSTAELKRVAGTYEFAEGPAVDSNGDVYFSDINAGKIYRWSPNGNVSVFKTGLNKPNGLIFDSAGNLIVCEGGAGRLLAIDAQGKVTVLIDQYNGKRFNEPNDLWIDPQGGIYFTDPIYTSSLVQSGEYVYYLSSDQVTRVISDLVRPNGIVGTKDGKTLFVADHGAGKIFVYTINADHTLANKKLFASTGSDGMELDAQGNLYVTVQSGVQIYNATGQLVQSIPTTEQPTNVAFAGEKRQTLFITARTAVYTIQMPTQ
jgi:gluconolactonase